MSIKRITTIVPIDMLAALEKHLRECGVPGVTVERVEGYGRHPNYFRRNLMKDNARLLLYAEEDRVDPIVFAISNCAQECGVEGGILTVEHVERLVNLTDRTVSESSSA